MTPEQEREAFEAWAKQYGRIFLNTKPKLGRGGVMYENQFTQEAWVGWQARASQQAPQPAQPTEAATIAGLESAGGYLAALVDEAQGLLTELREYARDLEKETLGGESERGEVSLLDRVDDWLDARPSCHSPQPLQKSCEK